MLKIGNFICLLGLLVLQLMSSINSIYFGLFLIGLSSTPKLNFGFIHLCELIPTKVEFVTVFTSLVDSINAMSLPLLLMFWTKDTYLGISECIVILVFSMILIEVFNLPESPTWLLASGRH